jgi:hypothetical protein
MVLSSREKSLLGLLALVLAGAALFFAAKAVNGYENQLRARIEAAEGALRQFRAAGEELEKLQRAPRTPALQQPLLAYLEQLARKRGLSDRLQLNGVPQDRGKNLEAVEVKLDALVLEELLGFVYDVENGSAALGIDQVELTPSFRSRDLVRLTMRVLAQR